MFSATELIRIAIKLESNGESVYRQAQQAVTDPVIRETLGWMADEERKHANWYASLDSNAGKKALTDEDEIPPALLERIIGSQQFSLSVEALSHAESAGQLLDQLVEFEQDTILFYELLTPLLTSEESKSRLAVIISEEHGHVTQLLGIKKKLVQEAVP